MRMSGWPPGWDRDRRAKEDVEFQARMADEIRRLFPGCPKQRATAIAEHAALRGSGRVGRAAAPAPWTRQRSPWPSSPRYATKHRLRPAADVRHPRRPRDRVRPVIDQVLDTLANGKAECHGTSDRIDKIIERTFD